MSFRRSKSHQDRESRAWLTWRSRHETALEAIGLPPSVTLDEDHWTDFLQNGYLERHPESYDGFSFEQLSSSQMSGLLAVLGASPEYLSEPMAGWLRVRLGRERA